MPAVASCRAIRIRLRASTHRATAVTEQPEAAVDQGPIADTWEAMLEILRSRYPGQKDSVLFCIHKLQQNPELSLRDFRAEAELHGIPMAGRSLHSARQLLGLVREPAAADTAAAPTAEPTANVPHRTRRQRRREEHDGGSLEAQVIAAVRQIQDNAGANVERLRAGIREAIRVLQRALGDDD